MVSLGLLGACETMALPGWLQASMIIAISVEVMSRSNGCSDRGIANWIRDDGWYLGIDGVLDSLVVGRIRGGSDLIAFAGGSESSKSVRNPFGKSSE